MSEKQTSPSPKQASASTESATPSVSGAVERTKAEIQSAWDEANEKGYWGEVPDETPNEAYTVEGVTKAANDQKKSAK